MKNEYADVALDQIGLSFTNTMFRDPADFTPAALADLVDSILKVGVLSPILVRPGKKKKYELVCGERRYRASLEAKLKVIPASIRDLKDDEALEAQVVENLQRENINPMKEAVAFEWMTKNKKLSAAAIADRIGKSADYVQERIKLTTLNKEAQELVRTGVLPLKAGLKIARIPEHLHLKALGACTTVVEGVKGKQTTFRGLAALQQFVDSVSNELALADFDINDEELIVSAGSCTDCTKRTRNTGGLFDDVAKKDLCLDGGCFRAKQCAMYKNVEQQVRATFGGAGGAQFVYRPRDYFIDAELKKKLNPLPVIGMHDGTEISKAQAERELSDSLLSDPKIKIAILVGKSDRAAENRKSYVCLSFKKETPSRTPGRPKAQVEKEKNDSLKAAQQRAFEAQLTADAFIKKATVKTLPDEMLRLLITTLFDNGDYDDAAYYLAGLKIGFYLESHKGTTVKVEPGKFNPAMIRDHQLGDLEKPLNTLKREKLNAMLAYACYSSEWRDRDKIKKLLKIDSKSITQKAKSMTANWWKEEQKKKAAAAKPGLKQLIKK